MEKFAAYVMFCRSFPSSSCELGGVSGIAKRAFKESPENGRLMTSQTSPTNAQKNHEAFFIWHHNRTSRCGNQKLRHQAFRLAWWDKALAAREKRWPQGEG